MNTSQEKTEKLKNSRGLKFFLGSVLVGKFFSAIRKPNLLSISILITEKYIKLRITPAMVLDFFCLHKNLVIDFKFG